jgi:hypothetical protein
MVGQLSYAFNVLYRRARRPASAPIRRTAPRLVRQKVVNRA